MDRATFLILIGVIAAGAILGAPAAQARCPGSAAQASKAIWASGNIPAGQRVTATHPCGRQIQCTGGTSAGSKTRHCRWL
jgi:hypothetical protein